MNRILILNDVILAGVSKKITGHQYTVEGIHHAFLFQYAIIEKYGCRLESGFIPMPLLLQKCLLFKTLK